MVDICIIYASKDEAVVAKLVALLRKDWSVWWDKDINTGDWERAVRKAIDDAEAIIPVISKKTELSNIFRDELELAVSKEKKIFPLLIEPAILPLGFGRLHRTNAFEWNGKENAKDFQALKHKIKRELGDKVLSRTNVLSLGTKSLTLPSFSFSLSSHETQLDPRAGVGLLELLAPSACLISAYDAFKWRSDRNFAGTINDISRSNCILFLDSGNYEAYRKQDFFNQKNNKNGWQRKNFITAANHILPDIIFSYDHPHPKGSAQKIIELTISNARRDAEDIQGGKIPVCPIVHLPINNGIYAVELAPKIISGVAKGLDPVMIAIPERELGDGITERARAVRQIRRDLDGLGKYYPLHLLGTGNPISILIFTVAGADSFDGLEWCRTVADWDRWLLFHYQHLDFFNVKNLGRLRRRSISIVESTDTPFPVKVACYNLEAFSDWIREIQDNFAKPEMENLMRIHIPEIGERLYQELAQ